MLIPISVESAPYVTLLLIAYFTILGFMRHFRQKTKERIEEEMGGSSMELRAPASRLLLSAAASIALLMFTMFTVFDAEIHIVRSLVFAALFAASLYYTLSCVFGNIFVTVNTINYCDRVFKLRRVEISRLSHCKLTKLGRKSIELAAYSESKKLFSIDSEYSGFDILYRKLEQEGIDIFS